jgi:cytochrome c biogenesis protein CcmG/thiol:disulfide interchange protein DsbE
MRWKIVFVGLLLTGPLFWILASGFGSDPHAVPFMLLDKPAPPFELQTLDGTKVDLASLSGKPVVLNFWSTWCEPCKLEHELLQRASQHYGESVQFLGVVYEDTAVAARDYLKARTNLYPQLVDPGSRTALDYGISGVPESFFITADGQVLHKEAGVVTGPLILDKVGLMLAGGGR